MECDRFARAKLNLIGFLDMKYLETAELFDSFGGRGPQYKVVQRSLTVFKDQEHSQCKWIGFNFYLK